MSLIEPHSAAGDFSRTQRAFQFPVGAVSPLWLLYAGAASAGMAYWWFTRWAKPVNLEAILGASKAAASAVIEAAAPAAEAVVVATEAAEESLEAVVEELAEITRVVAASPPLAAVAAPVIEAAPEPVIEAAPEPVVEVAPEPVVEAAPEPVVEAPLEPVVKKAVKVVEPTEILPPIAPPKPKVARRPRVVAKPPARR